MFYRTDAARGWQPDIEHVRILITPATRALVVIVQHPTGATYSTEARRALVTRPRLQLSAPCDEVYADLAFDGPARHCGAHPKLRHHLLVAFESVSRARWRMGWLAAARPSVSLSDRRDPETCRRPLCSNGP